ncbi:hypothetical protein GEMRC1_001670 [Eukaryota sp. GEM-RC1]
MDSSLSFVKQFDPSISSLEDLYSCDVLQRILSRLDPSSFPPLSPHDNNVVKKRAFVKTFLKQISDKFQVHDQSLNIKLPKVLAREKASLELLVQSVVACAIRSPNQDLLDQYLSSLSPESAKELHQMADQMLPPLQTTTPDQDLSPPDESLEQPPQVEEQSQSDHTCCSGIDDLKAENTRLQSDNDSLRAQLIQLQKVFDELQLKNAQFSQQLMTCQSSLSDMTFLRQEKEALEEQLSSQSKLIEELKSTQSNHEEPIKIDLSSLSLTDIESSCEDLTRVQLQTLCIQMSRKLTEMAVLDSKLESSLKQNHQLQIQMQKSKKRADLELNLMTSAFHSLGSHCLGVSAQASKPKSWLELMKKQQVDKM